MNKPVARLLPRQRAQSMVEFAIALPVLLLLIFGVIEFGRLLQAWMAVQNAARFGVRYLVTGEFNPVYCADAAAALNLTAADASDGVSGDCMVADTYAITQAEVDVYGTEVTPRDLSNALIDWARMPSGRDVAMVGGTGLTIDPAVSDDYPTYLAAGAPFDIANLPPELGSTTTIRYFHTTICSSRDRHPAIFGGDYGWEDRTYPELCRDNINDTFMDDAGGPGDRVRIMVSFNYQTIVPFISSWWPIVPLTAWREGIVERFRTSRISGIGNQARTNSLQKR